MTVFSVLHPMPQIALDLLEQAGEVRVGTSKGPVSREELEVLAEGSDALISLLFDPVGAELAERAGPGLKVVSNVAVGYDNLDVPALNELGIVVTNTPGVLTDATADLAVAMMLAITRRLGEGERLIRAGTEWAWGLDFMLGPSLAGKTLGIVGLGEIGQATARRARAFGMEIIYFNRRPVDESTSDELGARMVGLDELLAEADVVSLHCPLTDETRHLIDADALETMKDGAYLVNSSRGPIVDEAALAEALAQGVIAGAALDVFEHEPQVHPGLTGLENVLLIPHLGSATVETREQMALLAARNAIAVCDGRPAETFVGDLARSSR